MSKLVQSAEPIEVPIIASTPEPWFIKERTFLVGLLLAALAAVLGVGRPEWAMWIESLCLPPMPQLLTTPYRPSVLLLPPTDTVLGGISGCSLVGSSWRLWPILGMSYDGDVSYHALQQRALKRLHPVFTICRSLRCL